jgi:hypothetical protein
MIKDDCQVAVRDIKNAINDQPIRCFSLLFIITFFTWNLYENYQLQEKNYNLITQLSQNFFDSVIIFNEEDGVKQLEITFTRRHILQEPLIISHLGDLIINLKYENTPIFKLKSYLGLGQMITNIHFNHEWWCDEHSQNHWIKIISPTNESCASYPEHKCQFGIDKLIVQNNDRFLFVLQ